MDYVFSKKSKNITTRVALAGLIIFVLGIIFDGNDYSSLVADDGHNYGFSQRIWVALLSNGIFFFFISLSVLVSLTNFIEVLIHINAYF